MAFGDDEEILQDFLLEAGEIIEQLSEQLVELEQSPNDKDLLNAIFRGFHTVKGGAGFLQLNAMVDCCHVTENLFDILRNGDRDVTSELMDIVLQSLDTVTTQFDQLQNGEEPSPADPELILNLERLVAGEEISADSGASQDQNDQPEAEQAPESSAAESRVEENSAEDNSESLEISDEEFEGFLDAIDDKGAASPQPPVEAEKPAEVASSASDEITDDEFEALLDQLHGASQAPSPQNKPISSSANAEEKPASPARSASSSDEITEDEFESLLDELHGAGQVPKANADSGGAKTDNPEQVQKDDKASSDLISDDEFEDLLDQLHGKGTVSSATQSSNKTSTSADSATQNKSKTTASKKVTPPKAEPLKKAAAENSSPTNVSKLAPKPRDAAPRKPANGGQQQAPQSETTVRVDTQRLDDIMNMVGELVLVRNRLVRLGEESPEEPMQKAVANLDVVTADLQTAVMKTRMQPIKKVFGRFPRVVRDLARNLKKEINLELKGEETDLDKNLVEALADPLVHLVRNSVDHGIELPEKREKNGKSRVGKVILAAEQEGDHILLTISDDGGGMDPNALRQKAVEKGIMDSDAAARLTDTEAYNLIFAPGFSTKTEISDVSGRGVGMDVVKTKITQLNGSIEIQSSLGEGTRIIIKVPLTLAIMPTLMIMLGQQTFAFPLVSVNEIFHMDLTKISVVDGQECVVIREKTVPLFNLKHWLVKNAGSDPIPQDGHVVIVSVGTQRVGFIVDQLIGQEEVVIKPLGKLLQGTPGMAGATITGDGTIALILDVPSMLKRYAANNKRVA